MSPTPLRVAALVKQVPRFDAMALGADGRLRREGLELEMNPYCRRAVGKGVELAQETGGTCTVITLGPPAAEDTLREAIAWGADEGVLITDPAFAGSDTLATARSLAAAIDRLGGFDLVLVGRNSVDADTGQVGPELAELLDLPFLAGVRELAVADGEVKVRCEEDDAYSDRAATLPAVLSCAERLCEPCKVDPVGRAAVAAERIRVLTAADLGDGPWGQAGSPTWVGEVRVLDADRAHIVLDGPIAEQVDAAVQLLVERGALGDGASFADAGEPVSPDRPLTGAVVAVVVEPDRANLVRELLGEAAALAGAVDGHVVAITSRGEDARELASWGADGVVAVDGVAVEEDAAAAVASWCTREGEQPPWAVLVPGTLWGREVAARVAARLSAGLTGDAVELGVSPQGRLVAWKPAFGGQLVAAITATSPVQLATVRAGVLPVRAPRPATSIPVATIAVRPRGRVSVAAYTREDDLDQLASADAVVGVGTGVPPDDYALLEDLLELLGAELAATRKVTDKAWLPRARQVGITGRTVRPRLYVSIGASGKFNHAVGFRGSGTVLAINRQPDALVFGVSDVGIVADWREALPLLVERLREVLG